MNLTFSNYKLLKTSLLNDEGQVVFKINTTRYGCKWTSSIHRSCGDDEEQKEKDSCSLIEIGDTELLHHAHEIAKIHWRLCTSRVAFGSQAMDITQILTKAGPLGL
jgi:hypothetical protein